MADADRTLQQVRDLLTSFDEQTATDDVRSKVLALVPTYDEIREFGKSLIPDGLKMSARDRILAYFRMYPEQVLRERELSIVAGISEWARRVRELRVEFGWKIVTGVTVKEMAEAGDYAYLSEELKELSPNDYVLLDPTQDREAAHRWNVANEIRKAPGGSQEKILKYLLANVGNQVTGEELSYVAKSSEWARRVRELRTEEGWPIATKMSGNPELPIGVYVLESDRQAPAHDRHIADATRREALRRDNYACRLCGWTHDLWNPADPRFLELHHIAPHAKRGSNDLENLITYCNVCHDQVHKQEKKG